MTPIIPEKDGDAPAMLGRGAIALLAVACGTAVANAYYVQPLLVAIAADVHLSAMLAGLIPGMAQIGLAAGILLLLPLGDVVPTRRLLTIVILLQVAALAAMAAAPSAALLIATALAVGFLGITPYVLAPYATLHTPSHQRGRVTAVLTQGVVVGLLLARTIGGVLGRHFGWRVVYALAALLMAALVLPLRHVVRQPDRRQAHTPYPELIRSLGRLLLTEPAVRRSALCQSLVFGSFNAMWVGLTFHMQSPTFGWSSDGVGALAFVGALSAAVAPIIGRHADRKGPRFALLAALFCVVAAWGLLALLGFHVVGVIAGLVLLDIGSMASDIANRTIIFGLHPGVRTRLTALYLIGMFTSGGVIAWLTGVVWALGGWLAVCALGATCAGLALLVAAVSIGRAPCQE